MSFLESLLRTLLADHALIRQAKINTARNKMADYFFTNAPCWVQLMADLAKWLYQVAAEDTIPLEARNDA